MRFPALRERPEPGDRATECATVRYPFVARFATTECPGAWLCCVTEGGSSDCLPTRLLHAAAVCTVIVLIRPGHPWPVSLAANRDERIDRTWDPPAAWWPAHPGVIGGRDRSAGGTWMALGPTGVVAAVLNRPGTLGPEAGKRSRGDLPLLAASQGSAEAAAQAVGEVETGLWRGFNLVVADAAGALFLRGTGQGRAHVERLPPGLHMVTAHDPNDLESPRIARHLPRFRAARPPEAGGLG